LCQNKWIDWIKENYIRAKTRLFKKNQIIHYEGDHATGIYLVMSGKVKTMGEDGRELMTGIYQADDFRHQHIILSNNPTRIPQRLEDSCLCFFQNTIWWNVATVSRCCRKFWNLSHEIRKKDGYLCSLPTNLFGKGFQKRFYVYTNNTKME
jgi:signal-transduction protein with cAMP-binding, CBS, and nucleotidyltransferase domain